MLRAPTCSDVIQDASRCRNRYVRSVISGSVFLVPKISTKSSTPATMTTMAEPTIPKAKMPSSTRMPILMISAPTLNAP